MSDVDDPAEAPLDPATERVRRKMVRLLGVSIAIMLVGLMAVLAAVVYRASESGTEALAEGSSVPIALPAGEIVETAIDGERIVVRLATADGAQELVFVDRRTGAILSRHPLSQP